MNLLEQIEEYWNLRSNGFSSSVREELCECGESISGKICGNLGLERGSKVLDLGCGPGLFSILMARMGMEVIGVDYSPRMVETARENALVEGLEIEFMRMDAQDMDFDDGTFDAVVSRNMFWTLPEPERCYSEVSRVLKHGGKLLVMDGNFYLHHYNEDYRIDPTDRDPDAGRHGRHNKDNVDFGIMDRIAMELPLSRVERPSWDVNVLCKSGFTDIRVSLPPITDEASRSRRIPPFMIVAERG